MVDFANPGRICFRSWSVGAYLCVYWAIFAHIFYFVSCLCMQVTCIWGAVILLPLLSLRFPTTTLWLLTCQGSVATPDSWLARTALWFVTFVTPHLPGQRCDSLLLWLLVYQDSVVTPGLPRQRCDSYSSAVVMILTPDICDCWLAKCHSTRSFGISKLGRLVLCCSTVMHRYFNLRCDNFFVDSKVTLQIGSRNPHTLRITTLFVVGIANI